MHKPFNHVRTGINPPSGRLRSPRRGAITVWLILSIPVVITLLCVVAEVGNLWLARIELTNALEASALAAVKEWGDAGGGSTLGPRKVGNAYAMANTINGAVVDLTLVDDDSFPLNRDPGEACNENACNEGVLVFGAIIDDDPEFVFDCCTAPSCGFGSVCLDVTQNGNLGGQAGLDNQWGICYTPPGDTIDPAAPRIRRVVITLPPAGGGIDAEFNFTQFGPAVSPRDDGTSDGSIDDAASQNKVVCTGGMIPACAGGGGGSLRQADVFGINRNLVTFYIDVTNPCQLGNGTVTTSAPGTGLCTAGCFRSKTLALEFPDTPLDLGEQFNQGDRLRFGAIVANGTSQLDGDAIGQISVEVTVCFSDGSTVTSNFVDTMHPGGGACANCNSPNLFAPWGSCPSPRAGMIVHPSGTPDLPCPASAATTNNGQSIAVLDTTSGGGAGRAFAVRAQATYQVPSICCELFCVPIGPFNVQGCADALYDCATRTPRLYHLEERNFNCSVACP